MSGKILVTYASRTGWTEGVANEIASVLRAGGSEVDVLLMKEAGDLSGYRTIVAGSGMQDRQWLPEATEFLRTRQKELAGKPVATFTVCMTLAMRNGEKYRHGVVEWLEPVRRLAKPVSEGIFAGGLEIARIPSVVKRLNFRISVLMGIWKEGDHRNWPAIRSWAEELKKSIN